MRRGSHSIFIGSPPVHLLPSFKLINPMHVNHKIDPFFLATSKLGIPIDRQRYRAAMLHSSKVGVNSNLILNKKLRKKALSNICPLAPCQKVSLDPAIYSKANNSMDPRKQKLLDKRTFCESEAERMKNLCQILALKRDSNDIAPPGKEHIVHVENAKPRSILMTDKMVFTL